MNNIARQVKTLIAELLGVEVSEVVAEANLTDDLGADQEDLQDLTTALEETFDITLADQELTEGIHVQEVIHLVQDKQAHPTS